MDIKDNYSIENNRIKLVYNVSAVSFNIYSKVTKLSYSTRTLTDMETINVEQADSSQLRIDLDFSDNRIYLIVKLHDNSVEFFLNSEKVISYDKPVPFPGEVLAPERNQYFVVPYAEGTLTPATEQHPFGEYMMWGHKSTMPFVGVTDIETGTGIMITSKNQWDTSVLFKKVNESNNYCMLLRHFPSKAQFNYSRTFYFTVIEENSYNEMAKWYRKYLEGKGNIIPFARKMQFNGNIDKLIGAVDIWLGDNTKNKELVDDIISSGIKKALFNFQYGWYVYNNEKRLELIDYVTKNGMLTSRYDNYSDVFEPSASELSPRFRSLGYEEGHYMIDKDGAKIKGWSVDYKGHHLQAYILNSIFEVDVARQRISTDLEENNYNGRFIDVITSRKLEEDYSPEHPATRRQDAQYRKELLNFIKNEFKMVLGSEESSYWAMEVTDYGEGTMSIVNSPRQGDNWYEPVDQPDLMYINYTVNPTVRIPLVSLVYHDMHISTWYTGDGVSKVPYVWAEKDLFTILYGTMQLVFPPDMDYWNKNKKRYLRSIKMTTQVFEAVGYSEMVGHRFISSDRMVQETQFSNGITIVANFKGSNFKYNGSIIPAKGFGVFKGNEKYIYSVR